MRSGWRRELPLPLGIGLLLPVALLFGLLFVVPLGRVIQISLTDPSFGFHRYRAFFSNPAETKALLNTLQVSGVVSAIALAAGCVVAWTLTTTQSRVLRALLWVGTVFPLWMSPVVFTYIFTIALQRHGIVNSALQTAGLRDEPAGLLYNTRAVVVAMVYTLLPLAILPLYAAFVNIDPNLIRASQGLGASRIRALFSVVGALALPAFVASGALVFVTAMGFYVTPILLGSATRPFLASRISDQVSQQFDVPAAAAGSVVLVAIAVATVSVVVAAGRARLARAQA